MGIGDDVLGAGQARTEFLRTGKRVKIVDRHCVPRWSSVWEGLDWIARPNERGDFSSVMNGPGCRPYVQYPWNGERQFFTNWRARDHLGGIAFTPAELAFASMIAKRYPNFLLIEPNNKKGSNPNKQWGFARWQRLVDLMPHVRWIQTGARGSRVLRGVRFVETASFRLAAAVLSKAKLSVLPEGGLHHAAAHIGKPAVVVWGGIVPVETLGYPTHINIADPRGGEPCGNWQPCRHCDAVWSSITPEMVKERVEMAICHEQA